MSSKEKKLAAAAEEAKKNKKFYTKCIIFVVCLAIVVAAAALINSNLTTTKTTALQVGDTKYSPAEYSFFYRSALSQTLLDLQESYGELAAYLIDTSTPLDQQPAMFGDGEQTWADYFNDQAILNITNMTVLYDAAMKEGYTLSDEDKAAIEAQIAEYETAAASYGYADLDSFFGANFSKGFSEKLFREIAEKQYIASAYGTDLDASLVYTADEKEAYYSEHAGELDFVKYHYYFVGTSNAAFSEMSDGEKVAAAHEAAASIADAASGAQFNKNVQAFVSEESKASYEDVTSTMGIAQGETVSEVYREWMMDPARVEGDTTVIDTDGGSYALLFVSRNDNHYELVDVRHILISAEADENGEFTEEALETAKAEAERIYALWQEDPTEENFAALAQEYSTDSYSSEAGGLYEDVYQDAMVEEFNDFLFNEGKQPGDTGIVYGSNGSYAGYHVMYFSGYGELFSDMLADSYMRKADYNEVVGAMAENYELEIGSGMKFVNVA